jgi:hypothetical protein
MEIGIRDNIHLRSVFLECNVSPSIRGKEERTMRGLSENLLGAVSAPIRAIGMGQTSNGGDFHFRPVLDWSGSN